MRYFDVHLFRAVVIIVHPSFPFDDGQLYFYALLLVKFHSVGV